MYPSQRELRELLEYDPGTGRLTWRPRSTKSKGWNARHAGKEAGVLSDGYRRVSVGNRLIFAHRIAWILTHGDEPRPVVIDHANGVRDDNRAGNLRSATVSQNTLNSRRSSRNTSGFKGVSWCPRHKKWRAALRLDGKRLHLGYFADASEAHGVYASASREAHGEFARPA